MDKLLKWKNGELFAMSQLGGDTVGWSTSIESLFAHYLGIEVIAINCITDSVNLLFSQNELDDLVYTAKNSSENLFKIISLISEVISKDTI